MLSSWSVIISSDRPRQAPGSSWIISIRSQRNDLFKGQVLDISKSSLTHGPSSCLPYFHAFSHIQLSSTGGSARQDYSCREGCDTVEAGFFWR
jgi:hypothetical protein